MFGRGDDGLVGGAGKPVAVGSEGTGTGIQRVRGIVGRGAVTAASAPARLGEEVFVFTAIVKVCECTGGEDGSGFFLIFLGVEDGTG
jgi:hypothetical protein